MKNIILLFFIFSIAIFAADTGMQDTEDYISGGAKIAGLIMIVLINALWVIFPLGLGYISYSYFKRKSEQSQEDLGIKAGLAVFFSFIVGGLGAYYVVGSVGKYAGKKDTLSAGNDYIVSKFLGSVVKSFSTSLKN
ncbi:MAG: Unknown protein [uncultured Sulfurovum sp.]|uniref:Uncharacterized protein n=1 Tax=uncultured Sulfurovum sp. TaxID=269237 RepID=A0A6S6SA89_9BACT|nr:MAG: Unknown protein [uncultured Sulfurovum sp.]